MSKDFLKLRTKIEKEIITRSKKCKTIDDYLSLVFSFRIEGYSIVPIQKKNEIRKLLEILKIENPKKILEIGTANGGTLFLLCKILSPNSVISSIDLPEGKYGGDFYPEWKIPLYESFAKSTQKIHLIRDDSHDIKILAKLKKTLEGEKLDFVLIDGDHSYNGVKQDFEMYSCLVKHGGMIAFHDIKNGPKEYVGGVPKFWEEISSRFPSIEIINEDDEPGYGIGIIFLNKKNKVLHNYIKIKNFLSQLKIEERKEEIQSFSEFQFRENPLASLFWIFSKRPDLQNKYPEVKKGEHKQIIDWAIKYGVNEYNDTLLPHKKWYECVLSDIKEKEKQFSHITLELEDTSSKLKNSEEELLVANTELEDISSKLKNSEEELLVANTELEDISSKLKNSEEELLVANTELEDISSKLKNSEEELLVANTELEDISSKLKNSEEELLVANTELEDTSSKLKNSEEELLVANTELEDTSSKLKNSEEELLVANTELEDTSSKLKNSEEELLVANTELEDINFELSAIKISMSYKIIRKFLNMIDRMLPKKRSIIQKTEDTFFSIETEFKDEFSKGNYVVVIKGWCFHPKLKVKKLYIKTNNSRYKIANFRLPRFDVFNVHRFPNAINSGFWIVCNFTDLIHEKYFKIFLEIILENNIHHEILIESN